MIGRDATDLGTASPNKESVMTKITRKNVDSLLDKGEIECAMRNGNWWRIRRNGATKTWKRDANRVYIPYKMGLYGYGAITETDFENGILNPAYYRHA